VLVKSTEMIDIGPKHSCEGLGGKEVKTTEKKTLSALTSQLPLTGGRDQAKGKKLEKVPQISFSRSVSVSAD
jgi:hypothetical protein